VVIVRTAVCIAVRRTSRMRSATAKRSRKRCKAPAVTGWRVCRVHGAGGGAPSGSAHPNYRYGGRSAEAIEVSLGWVARRLVLLLWGHGVLEAALCSGGSYARDCNPDPN
jgi:hypothetical protein